MCLRAIKRIGHVIPGNVEKLPQGLLVQKLTLRISSRVLYVLSVCFALVSISLLVSKECSFVLPV